MSITGAQVVKEMTSFSSDPYVYGAAGPNSFDCSGLVQYSLEQLGLTDVPRTSEEQWSWVQQIPKSQLQPGDLVFAQFPGDNASPGHVGVYTGNGQVFSAQSPSLGIGYASLASWGSNVVGYGEIPGVNATGGGATSGTSGSSGSGSSSGSGGIDVASLAPDILKSIASMMGSGSVSDLFERLGLILIGALLVIFGIWRFTSTGQRIAADTTQSVKSASGGQGSTRQSEPPEVRAQHTEKTTVVREKPAVSQAEAGRNRANWRAVNPLVMP